MKKVLEKIGNWIVKEVKDYKLLLRSVPSIVTVLFVLSEVLMNLMANKVMFRWGDYVAADGGLLLSWIPFLCMDIVVKRFGPKAATKLNILAVVINIFCVLIFAVIAAIAGDGNDYSAFNQVFSCTWFILLGSTVAMVVAAIVNNILNWSIGKLFKKNPDGKLAYVSRSYISTFVAQFADNFLFAFIVFTIFAPIYWPGFEAFSIWLCIACGIGGAILELLMEVIFSPIGYKVIKSWKKENVGSQYLEAHPELEE